MKSLLVFLSMLMLWTSTTADLTVPPMVSEEPVPVKVVYTPPIRDKVCLAKAIYFEARNQTEVGKIGVAAVVLNRVRDWNKYRTVCGAVFDGCNFTWVCSGPSVAPADIRGIYEVKEWDHDLKLAEKVMIDYNSGSFKDVTLGATYFHTTASAKPTWAFEKTIVHTVDIDDHMFYRKLV